MNRSGGKLREVRVKKNLKKEKYHPVLVIPCLTYLELGNTRFGGSPFNFRYSRWSCGTITFF